ncbi:MAG TPA: TonB-dependent receptor [Asticcacaulis sp.]|nr:TonB-dependent receptor [Asticcacaulis sp.]
MPKFYKKASSLTAVGALALAAGLVNCGQANAQDSANNTAAKPDDSTVVVVTGFRQSYANAVKAKRSDIEITDSISSDSLGRFPDLNIGEALQRVPGIQLNREAEGREATIALRGLPGEYSRITLNGVAFAQPILQSSTPLGAFLSDIFSSVRVEKSPMAAAQSGGLSGNIDFQLAPALSRKDGGVVKANYDYNDLGGMAEPSYAFSINHHFTHDFAVFGVVSYKRENFRRDELLINSYSTLTATAFPTIGNVYADYYAPNGSCAAGGANAAVVGCTSLPNGTGLKGLTGVQFVSNPRQYIRINKGTQMSFSGGAEYRVNDQTKLSLNALYTDREQKGTYQDLLIFSLSGAPTLSATSTNNNVITPTGPVITGPGNSHWINSYSFTNGPIQTDTRYFPQTQKAWGVNGTLDIKTDKVHYTTIFTVSRADQQSRENYFESIIQGQPGFGASGTFNSGGGDYSQYSMSVISPNPSAYFVDTGHGYCQVPPPAGSAPGAVAGATDVQAWYDDCSTNGKHNKFNFTGTQGYATSKLKAVQQDVEYTPDSGFFTSIQGGFRIEDNLFISTGYRTTAIGIQGQNISNKFVMDNPFVSSFGNGNFGNYATNWKALDLDYAFSVLLPATPVTPTSALSPTGMNINYADNNYALYNFTNDTKLGEAYLEGKFKTEIFKLPIRGVMGLRYESADNVIHALDRDGKPTTGSTLVTGNLGLPTDYVQKVYEQKYDHLLPSAIVIFDVTHDMIVRVTGYDTYVRPHPRQFTPVTLVGAPSSANVVSVTLGNPNLKPYMGKSYDVSWEWYNRPNGLVVLDVFTKRITGIVQQVTGAKALCPADGSTFGYGTLSVSGTTCVSSVINPANNQPYTLAITGYVNSPVPYTINGAEFNVQQNLDFLPGFWKNFGGGFNYAYTEVVGTNTDGTKATLPNVSKNNANFIGYYETKKFGIRLVYNLRTKYLLNSNGSFNGAQQQLVKARGQLDMSSTYNITDRISASFDIFNASDALRYSYEGVETKPREADYDGRTYRLSLHASF